MRRAFHTEQMKRAEAHGQEIDALKGTIDNQIKEREELEKLNSALAEEIQTAQKTINQFVQQKDLERRLSDGGGKAEAEAVMGGSKKEGGERNGETHIAEGGLEMQGGHESKGHEDAGNPGIKSNLLALKEYSQTAVSQQPAIEDRGDLQKLVAETQAELAGLRRHSSALESQVSAAESKLATAETQLELFDQLRLAISLSVKELRPPQEAVDEAMSKFVSSFASLAANVLQFHAGIDDMGVKSIVNAAGSIKQEMEVAGTRLDAVRHTMQRASKAAQTLVMEYSEDAQEEPRRSPNGIPGGSSHSATEAPHPSRNLPAGGEKQQYPFISRPPFGRGRSPYNPTNGYA
jgi:chromosome segregation ATPase